jgi:hypothetical protein
VEQWTGSRPWKPPYKSAGRCSSAGDGGGGSSSRRGVATVAVAAAASGWAQWQLQRQQWQGSQEGWVWGTDRPKNSKDVSIQGAHWWQQQVLALACAQKLSMVAGNGTPVVAFFCGTHCPPCLRPCPHLPSSSLAPTLLQTPHQVPPRGGAQVLRAGG